MKKLVAVLVALICILGMSGGYAEDKTLDISSVTPNESVRSICWIQDTLYVLGVKGLYKLENGQKEIKLVRDFTEASKYAFLQEPPEDEESSALWKQYPQRIFTDGVLLYGIQPYSGEIMCIDSQSMNCVATIPEWLLYSEELMGFREIRQIAYTGETLFILLGTDSYDEYNKTDLYCFDLETESAEPISIDNVRSIAEGSDDSLLIQSDSFPYCVMKYTVGTGVLEETAIMFNEGEEVSGLVWDEADQRYARFSQGVIESIKEDGSSMNKAYLPVGMGFSNSPAACSQTGEYAFGNGQYIFIRDITGDTPASQRVLRVIGSINPNEKVRFSMEYPEITILEVNGMSVINAALSGATDIDLFVLNAPGNFVSMKEKGYIAPITNGEVSDWVDNLYASIQEVVYKGNDLLGIPINISVNSWSVNETVWNELGLGAYPATYADLFDRIAVWLDLFAADYTDFTLSDFQQNGLETLVNAVIKEYILQTELRGEQLSFDTEAFRNVLQVIAENSDLLSEDYDQWGMPILSSYSQGFGITYTDGNRVAMILPPAFDNNSAQRVSAELEVLAIHSASQQKEDAETFVRWYAKHINDTVCYEMTPTLVVPIMNPNYEARVQEIKEEINQLKARLEEAEDFEVVDRLEAEIVRKENQIEALSAIKWTISEESIENYRSIANNLRIVYESPFFSNDGGNGFEAVTETVERFCANGLEVTEISAMISELDRITYMIYMEAQ